MAVASIGTADTRLVVIRGNSGSGKTTIAKAIQDTQLGKLAVVGQDIVRRDVLRVGDDAGNPAVELIAVMVRHALDAGLHVVVEGILAPHKYGAMLRALVGDHRGVSRCYLMDIPFEETLRRHATKPVADEFGETEMLEWYRGRRLVDGLDEQIIDEHSETADSVARILADCGWAMR